MYENSALLYKYIQTNSIEKGIENVFKIACCAHAHITLQTILELLKCCTVSLNFAAITFKQGRSEEAKAGGEVSQGGGFSGHIIFDLLSNSCTVISYITYTYYFLIRATQIFSLITKTICR